MTEMGECTHQSFHSPSPGYSAACGAEERRGDRAVALENEGGWGFGAIPLKKPRPALRDCGELQCTATRRDARWQRKTKQMH